jgi:hypothetical protein
VICLYRSRRQQVFSICTVSHTKTTSKIQTKTLERGSKYVIFVFIITVDMNSYSEILFTEKKLKAMEKSLINKESKKQ